jgi:D-glycero-alpha-D-manno-heptose 1-phosphate guanylyltransferase
VATDEAIVLVGGLGTRLRAVVSDVPKPLAPVAGRPFLAWLLDRLAEGGMRHVVLAAGYLAERVVDAIGPEWRGMRIEYSIEATPLGTGGAVRQACGMLRGDAAHVLNGDTYLRYDMRALEQAVRDAGADLGMALACVDDVARYGAVVREGCRVDGFKEKGESGAGYINAGCYYLTSDAVRALPAEPSFSFETRVLAPLVAAGRVCGFDATDGFIDIGVPEDYARAQTRLGVAAGAFR